MPRILVPSINKKLICKIGMQLFGLRADEYSDTLNSSLINSYYRENKSIEFNLIA